MQDSNARTVRGLGIAIIVLSALGIVIFGLSAIAMGAFGAFASDPSLYGNGVSGGYHGHYDSLDARAAAGVVGVSLGIATGFLVWGALCSAVSLVAGILCLRNATKPEKLGGVFGWSIAGAVAAFLCGRIITTVLLVIAAIYANKLRNPAPAYQPQAYGQPYPMQQPGYGAPTYPQPQYQPQPQQQPIAPEAPQSPDQR